MGKEISRIKTTTRTGEKVEVRTGMNARGEKVSLLADRRGYETLNVDPKRSN